jgi:hypothetical protein
MYQGFRGLMIFDETYDVRRALKELARFSTQGTAKPIQ